MRHLLVALLALPVLSACGPGSEAEPPSSNAEASVPVTPASESQELYGSPTEGSVQLSTGVRLRYVEQGDPSGPVVVFLHGYTDSHHTWDLDLPIFPRNFHVYALDQRGHGDSSRPTCCYSQQAFAADVAAFLDAKHVRKASIVGHSMGSFIAQQVALDFPSRVQSLVLVGSAPTVAGNAVALGLKEAVDTLTDPVDPVFVREFQSSTFVRPVPASYLNTLVSESLKVPARVWKAALDGLIAENHSARLNRIRVPVLVLGGDQDGFFSAAEQTALANALPNARQVLYPATGHAPHAELPLRFVFDTSLFLVTTTR